MNKYLQWVPFIGLKASIYQNNRWSRYWQGFSTGFIITTLLLLWVSKCRAQIGYIDCAPFPAKCLVVSGEDFTHTKAWICHKGDITWKDSIDLFEDDFVGSYSFVSSIDYPDTYGCYIMVFDTKPGNDLEGYNLVGHETVHLLQLICRDFNVDFINEPESTAYLFEYLVQEIYKIINK